MIRKKVTTRASRTFLWWVTKGYEYRRSDKLDDYKATSNLKKIEIKHPINDFRKHLAQGTETNKIFHRNEVSRLPFEKNYNTQKNYFNARIHCFNCNDISHKSINCLRKKECPICFKSKNFEHKSDSYSFDAQKNKCHRR